MAKLSSNDYDDITRRALGVYNVMDQILETTEQIIEYFQMEYDKNVMDNPDFTFKLNAAIWHIRRTLPFPVDLKRLSLVERGFKSFELSNLQDGEIVSSETSMSEINESAKLVWKGTTGEFGAVISLLIEKGYLEGNKNVLQRTRFLMKHFSVKTKDGEEASA